MTAMKRLSIWVLTFAEWLFLKAHGWKRVKRTKPHPAELQMYAKAVSAANQAHEYPAAKELLADALQLVESPEHNWASPVTYPKTHQAITRDHAVNSQKYYARRTLEVDRAGALGRMVDREQQLRGLECDRRYASRARVRRRTT